MAFSIAEYSNRLIPVVSSIGQSSFFDQLMAFLKKLSPIDNAVILYYHHQQPTLSYNDLPPANRPTHIDLFLKGAYLLDPCYRAAQDGHEGFYRLDELAPVGFRKSEYYKNYFRHTGLIDECGYLFRLNAQAPGDWLNISLGRDEHHHRFSLSQQRLLQDIAPLLQSLCEQHWQSTDHSQHQDDDLHRHLSSALSHFGRSVLTEREAQIIQLFLHGHSTKSIAQKLSISPETVKLHRKHSYAKLDVTSQSELFYLFIDALSSMRPPFGGDPLEGYLESKT